MKSIIKYKVTIFLLLLTTSFSYGQQPNLRWAFCSGPLTLSVDVDDFGDVVSSGLLMSTFDFKPGSPGFQLTALGIHDIFFSKADALGNLLWVKQIKTMDGASQVQVAVDGDNNIYLAGSFLGSADFDPDSSATAILNVAKPSIFIAKYNKEGKFIRVKKIESLTSNFFNSYVQKLLVDNTGNCYLFGFYDGSFDFDPGQGTHILNAQNGASLYLLKLDTTGNLDWVNDFGGIKAITYAVSVSNVITLGDIALTKEYENNQQAIIIQSKFDHTVDFDPGQGTRYLNSDSGAAFIAKYTTSDGGLVWARNFGDTAINNNQATFSRTFLSTTINGDIYICGNHQGDENVNPGSGNPIYLPNAGGGIFILKLTAEGNYIWAKTLNAAQYQSDIVTDADGACYVIGDFAGQQADFDPGPTAVYKSTSNLSTPEIFILKLNASGLFEWVVATEGTTPYKRSLGYDISLDNFGNVYASGIFTGDSVDFAPGLNNYYLSSQTPTTYIGFTAKFAKCPKNNDSATAFACHHYEIGGRGFNYSGFHTVVLPTSSGLCDSIITLDLTLQPINNTISRHGDTLMSNAPQAYYQWYACDSFGNKTLIAGATNQQFLPAIEGHYAVAVTYQDCTDTSTCIAVNNLNIAAINTKSAITVVPNPVSSQCRILFEQEVQQVQLKLVNTLGSVVWKESNFSGKSKTIDMSRLSAGVYYLSIQSKGNVKVKKVVKW